MSSLDSFIHVLHLRNKTNVIYQDGKSTDRDRKIKNIFKKENFKKERKKKVIAIHPLKTESNNDTNSAIFLY